MRVETLTRVFGITVATLIPLTAATVAGIATKDRSVASNVFYITTMTDFAIFSSAAAIARRRSRNR